MVLQYGRVQEDLFMAYFLKKTLNKTGAYLQIYSSFYYPVRGILLTNLTRQSDMSMSRKKNGIDDPNCLLFEGS